MYISDELGWSAIFNIAVMLFSIGLAWWLLQSIRWDVFLKSQVQAKVLQLMIAVVLGYQFGKFIIEYTIWSSMLSRLF